MKTVHLDLIICSLLNLFYPFLILNKSALKIDSGLKVWGICEFQINFNKNIFSSKHFRVNEKLAPFRVRRLVQRGWLDQWQEGKGWK